jgi:tetratricopeptide (TPR) repeat protein
MRSLVRHLKPIVAAILATVVFSLPSPVLAETVDEMFARLQEPGVNSEAVEKQIWAEWSKSGSASMDLLLQRGTAALEAQDTDTAIGFLSALVDHAPEFAEGYNARATAFYTAGLLGPALADIRQTLSLNPRHFGAMTGLALILQDTGHPEDALEVWHEVQRLTPHNAAVNEAIERLDKDVGGETL